MADAPFEDFRFPRLAPGSAPFSRLVSYGAAATTVLLLGGAATWGYRIAVRDVSDVPVIRALETPMRIAPETPGGDEAPYSGLAVNAVPGGPKRGNRACSRGPALEPVARGCARSWDAVCGCPCRTGRDRGRGERPCRAACRAEAGCARSGGIRHRHRGHPVGRPAALRSASPPCRAARRTRPDRRSRGARLGR